MIEYVQLFTDLMFFDKSDRVSLKILNLFTSTNETGVIINLFNP